MSCVNRRPCGSTMSGPVARVNTHTIMASIPAAGVAGCSQAVTAVLKYGFWARLKPAGFRFWKEQRGLPRPSQNPPVHVNSTIV